MSEAGAEEAARAIVVGGRRRFPIGLSEPPPRGRRAPSGKEGWDEVAEAGVNLLRSGVPTWTLARLTAQIAAERTRLDAAAERGMTCWVRLGNAGALPAPSGAGAESPNARALSRIVGAFKDHQGLGAWKGVDEPANPFRPTRIPAAPLVRAYRRLKALDDDHPVVIIQAPRGRVAELAPYRRAFDVTGADIYPVSYPPGVHAARANREISVVGDIATKMVQAAGGKPIWMTLQIAWSGVAPSRDRPNLVPRFPSFRQERFMAYHAIVNGARGIVFFGGHVTEVCTPEDARAGWNWTFWRLALRPLIRELAALQPALVAPNAGGVRVRPGTPGAGDVELVTRRAGAFLYVIATRRRGTASLVQFAGLPRKRNGTAITRGEVMFEHVQQPPPPPRRPDRQVLRPIRVTGGGFRDWFGAHDVHVYRFPI